MESQEGYYIEQKGEVWRSTANKQLRPDPQSRVKNVIPRDRLVNKRGRFFTTDTSTATLQAEIEAHDQKEAAPPAEKTKPKTSFVGKNA